jgi:hypothetical protein
MSLAAQPRANLQAAIELEYSTEVYELALISFICPTGERFGTLRYKAL